MSFLIADWTHSLVHLGAILYLVCFAFRNQVALRLFAMAGDVVYTAYYFVVSDPPLWEAMFWSTANVAVNMIMLYLIFRDRQPGRMSDDELRLFRKLDTLSPGEFRRLVAAGTWRRVDNSTRLTDEGKQLDRLFYVLDGTPRIDKAGRSIESSAGVFIGEVAYLKKRPATASVNVEPGALYIEWTHAALDRLKRRQGGFEVALGRLLGADMAEKVARAN